MRILAVSVDAFPRMGGISAMGHHLANAFGGIGHDVTFLAPRGSYVPVEYSRSYGLVEDWAAVPQHRAGKLGIEQDKRIASLVGKVLRRYRCDRVLLLHPFYYGVGALTAAKAMRVPVSVYFHGFELRSQLLAGYPSDLRKVVREGRVTSLRERTLYLAGAADEILVNSRYTASLLDPMALGGPVRVTGCGISDLDATREMELSLRYDAAQRAERRRAMGLTSLPTLAYVGRVVPAKRVDRMLDIVAQDPSLGGLVVGDGPELKKLQHQAKAAGLDTRINFEGSVPESRKWQLLRASDYCCLLSEPNDEAGQVEGFGISLLEGAAAGCVPVSSGTGGMTDVVAHGETGLVIPPTGSQGGASLEKDSRDPEYMARLVEGARCQLRMRYTWTRVARNIAQGWQP